MVLCAGRRTGGELLAVAVAERLERRVRGEAGAEPQRDDVPVPSRKFLPGRMSSVRSDGDAPRSSIEWSSSAQTSCLAPVSASITTTGESACSDRSGFHRRGAPMSVRSLSSSSPAIFVTIREPGLKPSRAVPVGGVGGLAGDVARHREDVEVDAAAGRGARIGLRVEVVRERQQAGGRVDVVAARRVGQRARLVRHRGPAVDLRVAVGLALALARGGAGLPARASASRATRTSGSVRAMRFMRTETFAVAGTCGYLTEPASRPCTK